MPALCAALGTAGCGSGGPASGTPPVRPAPTPSPTATVSACARIGLGAGPAARCLREAPRFLDRVDAAIDRVIDEQPEVFAFDAGVTRVVSVGRYYVSLIAALEADGLCADFDGEELQVKSDGASSDQYDVLTTAGLVFRGPPSYRATCVPAVFPTPAPPLQPTPGCPLPPSREVACGRETQTLLGPVDAAIAKVQREHPEYFDFGDTAPGTDWPRILNFEAFLGAVVAALAADGLCARYDGEELQVKRENRRSEQFDIYAGAGYAWRGEGSYRATCFPAAF